MREVIRASLPVVEAIGPWDGTRLPPPGPDKLRLSFLVSDGLYFGEGPIDVMQQDPMAAPLFTAATTLLTKIVNLKTGQ